MKITQSDYLQILNFIQIFELLYFYIIFRSIMFMNEEQIKRTFRVKTKQISPKIQMLLHSYLKKQANSNLYFQQAQYSLYLQNNSHLTINFYAPLFNSLEYSMKFKGVQSLNHVNVVVDQNIRKILLYRNKCFEYYATRDIYNQKNNIENCIHKIQTNLEPNQKIVHISKGCLDRQLVGIHLFITNFGKLYNLKISKEKAEILCLNITGQISKYVNKIFNFLGKSNYVQINHYNSHLMKIDDKSFQTFNAAILKDWTLQIHFISIPLDPIIPKINEIRWEISLINVIKNHLKSQQNNFKILKSKMTTLANKNLILILLVQDQQNKQILFNFTINIQEKNIQSLKWEYFDAISQLDFHIIETVDKEQDLTLILKFDYIRENQFCIMVQSYSLKNFILEHQKQIKQKFNEESFLVLSENQIILASSLRVLGFQFQNQNDGLQDEYEGNNITAHLNNCLKNIISYKHNNIMRCIHDQNFSSLQDILSEKKIKINGKLMSILKDVQYQKSIKKEDQFKETQENLKDIIKTYMVICLLQEQIQFVRRKFQDSKDNQKHKYSEFFRLNQEELKPLLLSLDMIQYLGRIGTIKNDKKMYLIVMSKLIKMLQNCQSQRFHCVQNQQIYSKIIYDIIDQFFFNQFNNSIDKMLQKNYQKIRLQNKKFFLKNQLLQDNSLNYPELQQMVDQNQNQNQNQSRFFDYEDVEEIAQIELQVNQNIRNDKQEEIKAFVQKCIEILPFQKDIYRKYMRSYHDPNDFKFLYKIALRELNSNLFSVLFFETNFLKIKNLVKYYQSYYEKETPDCGQFVQQFLNQYLNEYQNQKVKKPLIPIGQVIETFRYHHEQIYMYLKERSPKIAVIVGLTLGKRRQLQQQTFQTSLTFKNPKYVKILLKACNSKPQVIEQELTAQICKKLSNPQFVKTEVFLSKVAQNKYQKETISKRSWDALKNHLLEKGQADISRLQKKVKLSAD